MIESEGHAYGTLEGEVLPSEPRDTSLVLATDGEVRRQYQSWGDYTFERCDRHPKALPQPYAPINNKARLLPGVKCGKFRMLDLVKIATALRLTRRRPSLPSPFRRNNPGRISAMETETECNLHWTFHRQQQGTSFIGQYSHVLPLFPSEHDELACSGIH